MRNRTGLIGLVAWAGFALVVDWISPAVTGLWPSALLTAFGGLLIWRTAQEVEPAFEGPERHRPWLQTTGWFLVAAGVVGVGLSLSGLL